MGWISCPIVIPLGSVAWNIWRLAELPRLSSPSANGYHCVKEREQLCALKGGNKNLVLSSPFPVNSWSLMRLSEWGKQRFVFPEIINGLCCNRKAQKAELTNKATCAASLAGATVLSGNSKVQLAGKAGRTGMLESWQKSKQTKRRR